MAVQKYVEWGALPGAWCLVLAVWLGLSVPAIADEFGAEDAFGSDSSGAYSFEEDYKNPDPWEGLNRKVFAFNEAADKFVLKPVAKAWDFVTPQFLDTGLSNMFGNVGEVGDIVHNFLQLKFSAGVQETGRVLINTTIGLAGFFDVASQMGIEKKPEDFGQTLAHWGVKSGPFIMLPFFGPSTLRDAPGIWVDTYLDPTSSHYVDHVPTRNTFTGVDIINTRVGLFSAESLIIGDKYVFLRDAWLQRREYDINDGKVSEDSFGSDNYGGDDFGSGDW